MKADLMVLGNGSSESSFGFYVKFDNRRYLFNCGDGTQRLCMEQKMKLLKLRGIFLSSLSPKKIGGLPGMLLTIYSMGLRYLEIYGPIGLCDYIYSLKPFVIRPDMKLIVRELYNNQFLFEDKENHFFVQPLILESSKNISILNSKECEYAVKRTYKEEETNAPEVLIEHDSSFLDLTCYRYNQNLLNHITLPYSISYLFGITVVPGAFLPLKAKELNIPKGPLYAQLATGHPITLSDGTIIQPEQVKAPSKPGPIILDVDIESNTIDLSSITKNPILSEYLYDKKLLSSLVSIYHNVPSQIFEQPIYKQFINQFPSSVSQFVTGSIVNDSHILFKDIAVTHMKLNRICPQVFNPFPFEDENNTLSTQIQLIQSLSTLSLLPLKPNTKYISTDLNTCISKSAIDDECAQIFGFDRYCELCKSAYNEFLQKDLSSLRLFKFENSSILLLGTGSAVPSKYRNVSGIQLKLNVYDPSTTNIESQYSHILLDCGEGTAGQINRLLTTAEKKEFYSTLDFVYISHSHADHHLGLPMLIFERKQYTSRPLILIAPKCLYGYLNILGIRMNSDKDTDVELIDLFDFNHPQSFNSSNSLIQSILSKYSIQTIPMNHTSDSNALFLRYYNSENEECSLVYTGDCRPNPYLSEIAKNTDILIHECSFASDKYINAKENHHSTLEEALYISESMNTYRCILTHFSQRYPKSITHEQKQSKKTSTDFSENQVRDMEYHSFFSAILPNQSLFMSEEDIYKLVHKQPIQFHQYISGWDYMNIKIQDLEWLPQISSSLDAVQISDEVNNVKS